MADLLAKYLAAIPADISTPADIRAWTYGFRFYVLPEFQLLASTWPNRAAARIAAIDTATINREVDWFRSSPVPTVGTIMTTPRYRELNSYQSPPFTLDLAGCDNTDPLMQVPYCTAFTMFGGRPVSAESIQTSDPSHLTVNLINGGIQLRRVGAFTGIASVTYMQTFEANASIPGIMFVRVRAPD